MKMSQNLFNVLKIETEKLKTKTNLSELIKSSLKAGNSETRVAFDLFYMIEGHSKFRQEIDKENLNDDHIKTAMLKIMKGL